jgi:hypothetical protein
MPLSHHPEVPRDYVMESAGGLSNMYMGHPQGPYSQSATRNDMYGDSLPRSDGLYGNMYSSGMSYNENSYIHDQPMMNSHPYAFTAHHPQSPQSNVRENYELIPQDETNVETSTNSSEKANMLFGMFMLFLGFFIVILWANFTDYSIKQYIFKGREVKLTPYGLIALCLSLIFMVIFYFSDFKI